MIELLALIAGLTLIGGFLVAAIIAIAAGINETATELKRIRHILNAYVTHGDKAADLIDLDEHR